MTEELKPHPETRMVCVICDQPWEAHYRLAQWRVLGLLNEESLMPTDAEIEAEISLYECVYLLKTANQGPQGPPGPVGPMGMTGPPGG